MKAYNPWPLGPVPKKFERPEIDKLRELGYDIKDARDAILLFEKKISEWAGSKYAIAVDSGTNALFLSLLYCKELGYSTEIPIILPACTYCSVPMVVKHAGYKYVFDDLRWSGIYQLYPLPIIDSAVRFTQGMHIPGFFTCLSFQMKKRLPIGKGGMILTDSEPAYKWFKRMSLDGRDLDVPYDKDKFIFGWHMNMPPEDAARGVIIFDQLDKINPDSGSNENYTDLRNQLNG